MAGEGCTQGRCLIVLLHNLENCPFFLPRASASHQGTWLRLLNAGWRSPFFPSWQQAPMQWTALHCTQPPCWGIRSSTLLRDRCASLLSMCLLSFPTMSFHAPYHLVFVLLPSILRHWVLRGVCACCILFSNTLPWVVASLSYVLGNGFIGRTWQCSRW